jgi:hypothetical protein
MNLKPWIDPRIRAIRPAHAEAYLLRHGWEPKAYPRPEVRLFAAPPADDGGPAAVVVPLSEGGNDYLQCLFDLITAVAIHEGRLASEIITEMLQSQLETSPPTNGAGVKSEAPVPPSAAG